MEKLFEALWKSYNVSYIFILPLFQDIFSNVLATTNYKISIHSITHSSGLINTFCLGSNGKYNNTFYLVFNKKILLEYDLYDLENIPSSSVLELFISSEYFNNILNFEHHIIIALNIPKNWDKDIEHIMNSNYSLLSKEFKNKITFSGNFKLSENDLINFLFIKNIAAKVITKDIGIVKYLNDLFKTNLNSTDLLELFEKFNSQKESLKIKTYAT